MDIPAVINDAIRYGHILTVAIGIGASFFADYTVLSRLRGNVTKPMLDTLHSCHKLIWFALAGMWISGLALIYLRTGFIFENFSPKLITKLVVVSVLTLNALMIGVIAMPHMTRNLHSPILDLPIAAKVPMAMLAGVSTTSWLLALALGSSKVLAASGAALFIEMVPICYLSSLFLALAVVGLLHRPSSQAVPA